MTMTPSWRSIWIGQFDESGGLGGRPEDFSKDETGLLHADGDGRRRSREQRSSHKKRRNPHSGPLPGGELRPFASLSILPPEVNCLTGCKTSPPSKHDYLNGWSVCS